MEVVIVIVAWLKYIICSGPAPSPALPAQVQASQPAHVLDFFDSEVITIDPRPTVSDYNASLALESPRDDFRQ